MRMTPLRTLISSLCLSLAAAVVPSTSEAQTNPLGSFMSMSTPRLSDDNMRVWTVTLGGSLASKMVHGDWDVHQTSGVTGGTAALMFDTGDSWREQVFYVRNGQLRSLRLDDGVELSELSLPLGAAGRSFANSDVAAGRFSTGEVLVAAISSDGRLCRWTGTTDSFTASPICSSASQFRVGDQLAVASFLRSGALIPAVFVRGANGNLMRAKRVSGTWSTTDLGSPGGAIDSPLMLVGDVGRVWVAVRRSDRVHVTPLNDQTTTATFTVLPNFPKASTLGYSMEVGRTFAQIPNPYGITTRCSIELFVNSTTGLWRFSAADTANTTPGSTGCPAVDLTSGTWNFIGLPSGPTGMSVGTVDPRVSIGVPSVFGATFINLLPNVLEEARGTTFVNHGTP